MLSKRLASTTAIGLLLVAGATACGDNDKAAADKATGGKTAAAPGLDTEKLTAEEIQKQAKEALAGAASVKITGSFNKDTDQIAIDLAVDTKGQCKGTLGLPGAGKFELLGDGKQVYLKPDAEFLNSATGGKNPQAVELLKGRWITGAQSDPELKELTSACDLKELTKTFDDSKATNITKGSAGTVNGAKTFSVKSKNSSGGEVTLHVATEGKPYPLRLEKSGKGGGQMDLTDIDKPLTVQAPPADQQLDFSLFKDKVQAA
ncbi:hypothetical protein [Kitasatospora purpeofusca]|uniref:hypothetical protein n=1 Tax=Kitasatospora purpeofusca TaxID=67352 RepID=UPI002254A835|nr:hypothetical protein [Kitasatospora purpeofusca]MCX4753726.1 hypothetical protein [Kitasatospora purpeofusca]WSR33207.1 hypothetical protein OG715_20755 [Kitasatospora purpeofusca]WSR41280.1 hypothetical protein OG196_20480 [Kitasatospora purpeofusca]